MPVRPAISLAACTLTLVAAAADAADRRPASFEHAEAALVSLIEFPSLRGDTTARLRCVSQVERSGKMEENGCYLNTAGDEVYVAAIVKAAKKARMLPAAVGDREIAVYVQYQVEFEQRGDDKSVRILNNPGITENNEAYGESHVAAQRGLTKETWGKACPKRVRWLVWAKAHVADNGQQSSVSIVPGEGAPITDKCRDAIVATMHESVFIPAHADGEPVPSTYVEPFGN